MSREVGNGGKQGGSDRLMMMEMIMGCCMLLKERADTVNVKRAVALINTLLVLLDLELGGCAAEGAHDQTELLNLRRTVQGLCMFTPREVCQVEVRRPHEQPHRAGRQVHSPAAAVGDCSQ